MVNVSGYGVREGLTSEDIGKLVAGDKTHPLYSKYPFYPTDLLEHSGISDIFFPIAHALFPEDPPDVAYNKFVFYALYENKPIVFTLHEGRKKYICTIIRGHHWGLNVYGPVGKADILIIGKMPGHDEYSSKLNFQGPSGIILRDAFRKIGLEDHEIKSFYVTNAVRWYSADWKSPRLPVRWIKNCRILLEEELRILRPKVVLFLGSDAVKGYYGPQENVAHLSATPKLETVKVYDDNGELNGTHTYWVFAAIHPAAVARAPQLEPSLINTLSRVVDCVKTGKVISENSKIQIETIRDEKQLQKLIEKIEIIPGLKKIAVDLEWEGKFPTANGSYVRTFQISHKPYYGAVIVLRDSQGQPCFSPSLDKAIQLLQRLFSRHDIQVGGSFFVSDIPWIQSLGIDISHLLKVPTYERFKTGDYVGIFDVAMAEHAHNEVGPFDLEHLAEARGGYASWSHDISKWRSKSASEQDINVSDLPGYGSCPDEILIPYAGVDVAVIRHLMDLQIPRLNQDLFGNSCWKAFYNWVRSLSAYVEMHIAGVMIDVEKLKTLTQAYTVVYAEKLNKLREIINWPTFSPRNVIYDCVELLFGEAYIGHVDDCGNPIKKRPDGAISLYLEPVKATDGRLWQTLSPTEKATARPSTDKETCSALLLSNPSPPIKLLQELRYVDHLLKTVLRYKQNGMEIEPVGIGRYICNDGRVHSLFTPIVETGRSNSVRPPLQNLAKRREASYMQIAGDLYPGPLRSILIAQKGYRLVEADFISAELVCAAILSRDTHLLTHCAQACLPEDNPDYYDIHSHIAVAAFKLGCPPTKQGMKDAGIEHLRTVAKSIVYGSLYGCTPATVVRQSIEEGIDIKIDDAKKIMDTFFTMYPMLGQLQERLCKRVENPGWIRTYYGRYRRFYKANDEQTFLSQQREAMNFPCQSLVADTMNLALHNLAAHPDKSRLGYRILVQIHDAGIFEVPERSVDEFVNRILPECMCEKAKFPSCDLDGNPYPDSPLYNLSIDISVL